MALIIGSIRNDNYRIPNFKKEVVANPGMWISEDLPISESERVVRISEETLGFESFLYRLYRKDEITVFLWLAYWKPGQKDIRAVHWHSPDICWRTSGWASLHSEDDYYFDSEDRDRVHGGNYRIMEKDGEKAHILFWHLVGKNKFEVQAGYKTLFEIPETLYRAGFMMQGEQYFIRISSNYPLKDLERDPGFQMILDSVFKFNIIRV